MKQTPQEFIQELREERKNKVKKIYSPIPIHKDLKQKRKLLIEKWNNEFEKLKKGIIDKEEISCLMRAINIIDQKIFEELGVFYTDL